MHMRNHRMTVLNIRPFHRNKHNVGIQAVHDVIRCVRQQRMIFFRVDVWSRRAGLSD
jgi:hypothetical protein